MTYTAEEHEVFGLKAASETLDEMLNHRIFKLFPGKPAYVQFRGPAEQQVFNVFLLDFVSQPEAALVGSKGSHLEILARIASQPSLAPHGPPTAIADAVNETEAWLSRGFEIELWIPSLNAAHPIHMTRLEMSWIAGNIAKHKSARLTRVTRKIQEIVQRSGITLKPGDLRLVLDDLDERFNDDLLLYHANALAEMLNNVRWAVHEYLLPHYEAVYRNEGGDPPVYRFEYPNSVSDELARSAYWDLMNEVRRKPFMERFTIGDEYKVPARLAGQY